MINLADAKKKRRMTEWTILHDIVYKFFTWNVNNISVKLFFILSNAKRIVSVQKSIAEYSITDVR